MMSSELMSESKTSRSITQNSESREKVCVIIPARSASSRFPDKVFWKLFGMPMIEHVYRRTRMVFSSDHIYITSGDTEILEYMSSIQAQVVESKQSHENGTSRSAEAAQKLNYSAIIVIQADEILLDPNHVFKIKKEIENEKNEMYFNLTSNISSIFEYEDLNIVKCMVDKKGYIKDLFRAKSEFPTGSISSLKLLGIMGFKYEGLIQLRSLSNSEFVKKKSIEQLKILENGYALKSVLVQKGYPSINSTQDIDLVLDVISTSAYQRKILAKYVTI